jgi:hypothetical protein
MNMVEFGYALAVGLILMVIGVHGARILQRVRDNRIDDGGANGDPAVGFN